MSDPETAEQLCREFYPVAIRITWALGSRCPRQVTAEMQARLPTLLWRLVHAYKGSGPFEAYLFKSIKGVRDEEIAAWAFRREWEDILHEGIATPDSYEGPSWREGLPEGPPDFPDPHGVILRGLFDGRTIDELCRELAVTRTEFRALANEVGEVIAGTRTVESLRSIKAPIGHLFATSTHPPLIEMVETARQGRDRTTHWLDWPGVTETSNGGRTVTLQMFVRHPDGKRRKTAAQSYVYWLETGQWPKPRQRPSCPVHPGCWNPRCLVSARVASAVA